MEYEKNIIVEDERIIAHDISLLLDTEGYQVLSIQDRGKEALDQIEIEKPDLVLIDIDLPGEMDGIELSREVGLKMKIPVIFVTAFTEKKTIDRAMETNPAAYIMKPIFDEDLLIEIRNVLK